ncbi:MAG TPA: hypothetical protein VJQ48_10550, partial [Candidatus Binatia bacterium]|nr:hypothetical protein [Candidatus Binatia bacterium]
VIAGAEPSSGKIAALVYPHIVSGIVGQKSRRPARLRRSDSEARQHSFEERLEIYLVMATSFCLIAIQKSPPA